MSKCDDCQKEAPIDELIIDHLLPRSHVDFNEENNLRMVHRTCHRRQGKWYWRLWWAIQTWYYGLRLRFRTWLRSWLPCGKELRGYRCYHRTYPDGTKECGDD